MLKKMIKYTDFDGVERNEPFYFNLSKDELWDMEYANPEGSMRKKMQLFIDKNDIPKMLQTIKEIIAQSYGEKSTDGRRFIKSKELSEAFMQTGAYTELYMELISDAKKTAAFLNAIIPAELRSVIEENDKKEEANNVSLLSDASSKSSETEGVSLLNGLTSET